jgi:O-antigen ligase
LITYALIISVLFIKTASISSLLSLIIGLGILFTSIITKSKFDYKKIIIVTVSLSLVLLMSGQLFIAKTIDIFNQIANPEQTIISDSFIIRTKIWNGTLNLLKNEPIFNGTSQPV